MSIFDFFRTKRESPQHPINDEDLNQSLEALFATAKDNFNLMDVWFWRALDAHEDPDNTQVPQYYMNRALIGLVHQLIKEVEALKAQKTPDEEAGQ